MRAKTISVEIKVKRIKLVVSFTQFSNLYKRSFDQELAHCLATQLLFSAGWLLDLCGSFRLPDSAAFSAIGYTTASWADCALSLMGCQDFIPSPPGPFTSLPHHIISDQRAVQRGGHRANRMR
jgi:hypothetical protein